MMTDTYKGLEDGRDKLDRLTDLPINVIHQIQEYMTVEDATRMSVLSSKWRHVWASNPKLIISVDFLRCLEYLNTPYKLPSSMYGVELEHLNLSNCIFRPPCSFRGFHKLKSLSLNQVTFQLDVATSFLCVPNLKSLTFEKCIGLTHLNICAPELLTLKILRCDIETIKLGPFMDCRKLQYFAVISRDEVPQNGQHEAINLIKLLSSWPELRTLLLDRYFIKFLSSGNVAGLLSTRLNDLHNLAFCDYDFNDEDQVCSLLCVLRSSPNLKSLVLVLSHIKKGSGEVDVNHLEELCCRIGEFNNLQALRICYFHGTRVELLFVRSLLASAPSLQEIIIEVDKKVIESEATKIAEELMQFPHVIEMS